MHKKLSSDLSNISSGSTKQSKKKLKADNDEDGDYIEDQGPSRKRSNSDNRPTISSNEAEDILWQEEMVG